MVNLSNKKEKTKITYFYRTIDKGLLVLPYKLFSELIKFTIVLKQPDQDYNEQALQ